MSKLRKRSEFLPQAQNSYRSVPIVVWDACHRCTGEDCPISERCEYCGRDEKCLVMYYYLDNVFNTALDIVGKRLNRKVMHQVGLHIVPLYAQLIRFKISELGVRNVTYFNDKGNAVINPIFREIRSTIKMIDDMWKQLGFKEMGGSVKEPKDIEDLMGDDTYYEDLTAEMEDE